MPEEDEEIIEKTSKLDENLKRELAGEVRMDLKGDVEDLVSKGMGDAVSKEFERIRPSMEEHIAMGMEDRITAGTKEALQALNYRMAQTAKMQNDRHEDLVAEIRLLGGTKPEVAEEPPEEKPPEEAPAEEPPEEKPPEEEAPAEEKPEEEPAEEAPEEKPEEEGDLEPIVGHCAHCSVGFSKEDKKVFKKCPKCGRDIEWED